MPLLDVTEVIVDPDFMDTMTYTRNTQVPIGNGRYENQQVTLPAAGVITMDRGSIINRIEAGSYVDGSILIHTLTRLRVKGAEFDSDSVTWNGTTYTVKSIGDYSRYGAGFIWAVCVPMQLSGGE